jgi:RNA polymerase sigma factor (sigma-70 family)
MPRNKLSWSCNIGGVTTQTDAQLLFAARTDPHAFRELYDRYADRIHGYHRRRTRDDEAAYDLTAETFAQAWLVRARFDDRIDGSAGPWLFAIARNVLLMSVRRMQIERRARERLGVLLPHESDTTPDETWLDGLDEALDALPASQREALRLRIEHDLDYERVADRLGTTPQAARVRVHRALSTLRRRLEMTP